MIRRLYVNNFRCLENFELRLAGLPSVLLIGKNGSGKSTVALALEILRKIARGTVRVSDLAKPKDFTGGRTKVPMRFEIEVELRKRVCVYELAFELPEGAKELQVVEELFTVDRVPLFARSRSEVSFGSIQFGVDPRIVNLAVMQFKSGFDPLSAFKQWLEQILVLRPIPQLISGESHSTTLAPSPTVDDFGAWFTGVLLEFPSAYAGMERYLKRLMPDLKALQNAKVGEDARNISVQFSAEQGGLGVPFADLSDGEKCLMICALVLAANDAYGPLFCFWDEPDNYLALDEVQHFVMDLRRGFQNGGQFIATSHNPEAIASFSRENTLYLYRKSHLEPTLVRPVSELNVGGDLVGALTRGDVEP